MSLTSIYKNNKKLLLIGINIFVLLFVSGQFARYVYSAGSNFTTIQTQSSGYCTAQVTNSISQSDDDNSFVWNVWRGNRNWSDVAENRFSLDGSILWSERSDTSSGWDTAHQTCNCGDTACGGQDTPGTAIIYSYPYTPGYHTVTASVTAVEKRNNGNRYQATTDFDGTVQVCSPGEFNPGDGSGECSSVSGNITATCSTTPCTAPASVNIIYSATAPSRGCSLGYTATWLSRDGTDMHPDCGTSYSTSDTNLSAGTYDYCVSAVDGTHGRIAGTLQCSSVTVLSPSTATPSLDAYWATTSTGTASDTLASSSTDQISETFFVKNDGQAGSNLLLTGCDALISNSGTASLLGAPICFDTLTTTSPGSAKALTISGLSGTTSDVVVNVTIGAQSVPSQSLSWTIHPHVVLPVSGSISASPNPCTTTGAGTLCTTYLTYSTTNASDARVYVSQDGGAEIFTQSGTSCANTACPISWISPGSSYVFNLYDYSSGTRGSLLGTTTVTATNPSHTVSTVVITGATISSTGGTISPGSRSVPDGSTTTFTVTPASGYNVGVSGCGGTFSGTTYTTGAITSDCTVTVNFSTGLPMSGTLTSVPATPYCNIPADSSFCQVTLNWDTTNPVGTSQVTNNVGMASSSLVNKGSKGYNISYFNSPAYDKTKTGVTFYLYNNAIQLASLNMIARCALGTAWNTTSQTCMTTGDMTGSLTPSATKCFIFPGASDCVVQLGWSVINPTTVNASYVKVGKNTIATTDMMSNMSAIMPYGLNTVTLYNTGISLDTTTIEAACVVSSVWDPVGGTCKSSVGPTVGLESPSGSSISGSIKIKGYAVPTPTSAIKKIELWTASTPTLVASSDPTSPKYIATFSGVARSDLTQFASNPAFPNIGFLYPSFNTALLGDGAHTITIKAYDLAGNVTTVNTSVAVNNSTNVCGAANNTLTDTMPSTGLCNTGTPSVVSGGTVHPWRWTCTTGSVVKRCGAPYRDANYCNEYLDFGQTAIVNIFSNGFFTPYNWTHVGLQPLLTNPTGSLSNNGSVSLTYGQQPGQTGISFWGSAPPASLAALGATSGTTFPAPVCTVTVDGPDLTASDPTPVSFLAGTPITFTSIVSNMGTVGTVDSFTNVFQLANDSSGSGATIISSSIMTALSPQGEDGSFQTTTSDPHTFTSPGTYYVRACADENASMSGSIVESNENNNCSAWIAVTVTGFDTDLIVTDTGHTPGIVGGPTLFSGTIKNIGTHTSYGSYATNILLISTQPDDHHVTRMVTSPLRNIDPGASAQANFSFNFWASGTYYFSVCADVSYFQYDTSANQSYYLGSNIPETNETNNCSTWSSINVLYATGTMSVNAGFDQYVTLPQTSTTFYGYALDLLHAVSNYSGSYNYSGQEPAVTWTKISGPSGGTIVSPNYLFTGVTNLTIPGVYTYRLTAVENDYFKTIVTSVCSDPEDDSTCSLTTLPNPNYDPTLYSDDMTITVSPATPLVPPSVTFSAVPTTLYQTKNSASLSWSAPDATSCVGASSPLTYANKAGATITINSPFNVTLPRVTGSMSVNPPVTTDYTVTCTGKGGVTSKTVKVKTVFVNVGEN